MKLFFISNHIPTSQHSLTGAVNLVQFHLLDQFSRRGHQVVLQSIYQATDRRPLTTEEQAAVHSLCEQGIEVLPPIFRSDYSACPNVRASGPATWLLDRARQPMVRFYPSLRLRPLISDRLQTTGAEMIFVFWNAQGLAATFGNRRLPKFVYYGVPDHMPGMARLRTPELFSMHMPFWRLAFQRHSMRWVEKHHLRLMLDCDVTTNLCADHANYYARKGHPYARYVQNMWPLPSPVSHAGQPKQRRGKPKIVGSLGRTSATGNTYGLHYIGTELAPRLDALMGPDQYELNIFGHGELSPALKAVLQSPSIKLRGWIDDIDSEIASSDVFLVANNTGPYRGAHTRFLHAWSLGACCVGHSYNSFAMPEMISMQNALLADTPDDIAALTVRAIREPDLRRRIGQAGRETFQEHFKPEVVAGKLLDEMSALADRQPPA